MHCQLSLLPCVYLQSVLLTVLSSDHTIEMLFCFDHARSGRKWKSKCYFENLSQVLADVLGMGRVGGVGVSKSCCVSASPQTRGVVSCGDRQTACIGSQRYYLNWWLAQMVCLIPGTFVVFDDMFQQSVSRCSSNNDIKTKAALDCWFLPSRPLLQFQWEAAPDSNLKSNKFTPGQTSAMWDQTEDSFVQISPLCIHAWSDLLIVALQVCT